MDQSTNLIAGQPTMEPVVAIDVQTYRLGFPGGQSTFMLQSPVPSERVPDGKILVRQEQGQNSNQVAFRALEELAKVDGPPQGTYAHGVVRVPRQECDYREGDAVWLFDEEWKLGRRPDQNTIGVVNLRTWKRLGVSLQEIYWVPKYRKLDHSVGEEELLTICGPPIRRASDRRIYVLAIVQRLRVGNHTASATSSNVLQCELREFVVQEIFSYQNMSQLPDGKSKIEGLFRRIMGGMAQMPLSKGCSLAASQEPFSLPFSQAKVGMASALAIPPAEDDGSRFKRDVAALWSKAMANLTAPPGSAWSTLSHPGLQSKTVEGGNEWAGPQPQKICNLPARQCRTPPHIFFVHNATRPSLANLVPTHHHLLDHECPSGGQHEMHCVFTSPRVPKCIIPHTVKHNCCKTRLYPPNKRICQPPALVEAPPANGRVVVKQGSGTVMMTTRTTTTTSVKDEEEYADLPIDVQSMPLDPQRDFDVMGWRDYGAGQRNDLVNGKWICAGLSIEGVVGDLSRVVAARLDAASGPMEGVEKEPETFGDRHMYEDGNVAVYGDDAAMEAGDGE